MNIDINASQLEAQANELEKLSSDMKGKTVQRLNGVIMNMRAAWEGDAAAHFDQHMTQGEEFMESFSGVLKDNASSLREIAKEVRKLQEQAKQQAMQ